MKMLNLHFFLASVLALSSTVAFADTKAILGDLDGDQISDLLVTRNTDTNKYWFIRSSTGSYSQPILFGKPDDVEFTADFDGDGDVEPSVVRTKTSGELEWLSLDNTNKTISTIWGEERDEIKTGHFDSDIKADKVVIRLETSNLLKWYIKRSSDSLVEIFTWGIENDIPIIGNFDDDELSDATVLREVGGKLIWYIRSSKSGIREGVIFGISGDKHLQPADLDGNGIDDFIVVRNVTEYSTIYVRYNNEDGTASKIDSFSFGLDGDQFTIGNYTSASSETILASRTLESSLLSSNFIFKVAETPSKIDFGLKGDNFVTPNGRTFEIGTKLR